MKIALISDIHVDFDADRGDEYIARCGEVASEADVLVVAGDVCEFPRLHNAYLRLRTATKFDTHIITVLGNHDSWRSSLKTSREEIIAYSKHLTNFHVLEKSSVEVHGHCFHGCTLWYPTTSRRWSDFRFISDLAISSVEEARESKAFLVSEVKEGDIVVTHMLPGEFCVSDEWAGDLNNQFFVHACLDVIETRRPSLWLHGHSHSSGRWTRHDTQVYRHPRAYPHERPEGIEDVYPIIIEV